MLRLSLSLETSSDNHLFFPSVRLLVSACVCVCAFVRLCAAVHIGQIICGFLFRSGPAIANFSQVLQTDWTV